MSRLIDIHGACRCIAHFNHWYLFDLLWQPQVFLEHLKVFRSVTLSNIDYVNSRYNKRYLKVRTVQDRIASILENELRNIQVEM